MTLTKRKQEFSWSIEMKYWRRGGVEGNARKRDRRRLTLFSGTRISNSSAIAFAEEEITFDLLVSSGVVAENVLAAEVGPVALKYLGAKTAQDLRKLKFNAIHLCSVDFANEMCVAFGSLEVVTAFLVSPRDAVCVAGTAAAHILHVSVQSMLALCVCSPQEATAVLEQLPQKQGLLNVSAQVVIGSGLRAEELRKLGYGIQEVATQTGASGNELSAMGFVRL